MITAWENPLGKADVYIIGYLREQKSTGCYFLHLLCCAIREEVRLYQAWWYELTVLELRSQGRKIRSLRTA